MGRSAGPRPSFAAAPSPAGAAAPKTVRRHRGAATRLVIRHRAWLLPSGALANATLTAIAQIYCTNADINGQPVTDGVRILIAAAFVGIGLLLVGEDTFQGISGALVTCGVLWSVTWLGFLDLPGVAVLSALSYPHVWILLCWAALRYPTGRLESTAQRAVIAAGYVAVPGATLVQMMITRPEWFGYRADSWWPAHPTENPLKLTNTIIGIVDAAVLVWFVVVVWQHLRRISPFERRVLAPVVVALVTACAMGALFRATTQDAVYLPTALALLVLPLVFGAAALRRRLARERIALLLADLPAPPTLPDVRRALRAALYDPTAEIYVWIDQERRYIDADGAYADSFDTGPGRLTIRRHTTTGTRLALVDVDAGLEASRGFLDIALNAMSAALENVRLQAVADRQLREVRAASARLATATIDARRQLERDLHDGAQQRLLALSARLGEARHVAATDPNVLAALDAARVDLAAALDELRALARGLYPALLASGGLGPALEAVADALPLTITINVPAQRFSPAVEATIYFTVCEALANAVKHARATTAVVTVARSDDGTIQVTAADDGIGGARAGSDGGLAGLTDRLAALGGTLTVESPPGRGTRLVATIAPA